MVICTILLIGCSNTSTNENKKQSENIEVKVIMPDGLPAVGIAKIVKEKPEIKNGYNINYNIEKTPDTLSTAVMKQEADIAIVPSNMADIAYNKTGNYKIAGTIGMGYIIKSLNEEYKSITKSKIGYPQATIIVKSDFYNDNKEFISNFLNNVDESVKFAIDKSAYIIGFSVAFPTLYNAVLGYLNSIDRNINEMMDIYSVRIIEKIRYVYIPSIKIKLALIVILTFSLGIKVVIAGEIL